MRKITLLIACFCLLLGVSSSAWGKNSILKGSVKDNEGRPVAGVVVSDGFSLTTTDSKGEYALKTKQIIGNIFICQPSGYDIPIEGVLPQFWKPFDTSLQSNDKYDFTLNVSDNREYELYALGDFHLCDRRAIFDLAQFKIFAQELNAALASARERGKKAYVLTLGDMTWDIYWDASSGYKNCNFDLAAYKKFINEVITEPVAFYHTIGNHDHDYRGIGDKDSVIPYLKEMGPAYYSFNLGKVHYIVLDDVVSTNNGTIKGRGCNNSLTKEQINWVKKEMAYVPADAPVVVSMHMQALKFTPGNGEVTGYRTQMLGELIKAIGNHKVHFVTGDTHMTNNAGRPSDLVSEHNANAVCSTWWWTGRLVKTDTPYAFQMSRDGSPAGYTVYDVKDTQMTWRYKGIGLSENKQFKTYDMNKVVINSSLFPGKDKYAQAIDKDATKAGYDKASSDNLVYINVWNYDPSWTISVTELIYGYDDAPTIRIPLEVSYAGDVYDPCHLVAYNALRYAEGGNTTGSFRTRPNTHTFAVKATTPRSTLEIVVMDGFGRVYEEKMSRPKEFSLDWE